MSIYYGNELYHHGILGQKWGTRRYQNEDGTLTPEGKQRYLKSDGSLTRAGIRAANKRVRQINKLHGSDRVKAQGQMYRQYGITYTNAKIGGARDANKIAKNARKNKTSQSKEFYKYYLKQAVIGAALTAGAYAAGTYCASHPEQVAYAKNMVAHYGEIGIYNVKNVINEAKVQLNPNIVDASVRSISNLLIS